MIVTFQVSARTRPDGGAKALYEFGNAMSRRGHSVHLMHISWSEPIRSLRDLPWIQFEDGIEHSFPGEHGSPGDLPDADFMSRAYYEEIPLRHGLPFMFLQGANVFPPASEDAVFRAPCPKVCVSRWLVDIGKERGVPSEQLVYIPNGLEHEKYRLIVPVEDRPPLVSFAYRGHPVKDPRRGLDVLAEVKSRMPDLQAVVFSQEPLAHETAPWMTVLTNPPQDVIVNEIYNRSSVFVCTSLYEGFGFPCVEAMACGAALVTTDTGGSRDYAIDGETALVSEPGDVTALADNVERLLRDDELRIRLGNQGRDYVREHFDWDASAEKLEAFLGGYAADPQRYGSP